MAQIDWSQLGSFLSASDLLVTDVNGYDDYFHDATEETGQPAAILFAHTNSDLQQSLKFCYLHNIPVVTRGAGTGLSGGCVPSPGSLLLSVERMTAINIDPEAKIAYAQAGAITKDIMLSAEAHGLTYPPDPASYEESTIGGNIAENAGGLRCVKYGVTRDYVLGLKGYTIQGEPFATGCFKQTGFNYGDLFIGSEGTLAVITEVALKLIDQPKTGTTILAAFDSPKEAAQTVSDIRQSGLVPTVMEFLDGDAADCSNQYEKTEGLDKAGAILLFEIETEKAQQIEKFCQKNNNTFLKTATDQKSADSLWKIRRNLSKAVKAMAKIRINEDVAVPISKFPALVDYVARINQRSPLRINSFGHAGDGNLHVNFLGMTGDKAELDLIEDEIFKLLQKTLELGGTLSGEHGIGLAKKRFLGMEFSDATLNFMKKFKDIFDPADLLNPDKIFQKK